MQVTDEMLKALRRELKTFKPDDQLRRALTAALSDQERAVEVKIKPLEWRDVDGDIVNLVALARTAFDTYFIERDREGFVLKLGSTGLLPHPTFEAAKAAAQADYERRIRSALVDVPAVEPVAWTSPGQMREIERGTNGVVTKHGDEFMCIPLYTHPPLREGEDSAEVLRSALQRISELTPARANARDARDLHLTVKAIAEVALAATRIGSATTAKGGAE